MPVLDIQCEDSICFAREVGYLSREDAEQWAEALSRYASLSPTPVAALIDARDVTFIAMEARMIYARAAAIPNLAFTAVVANCALTVQFTHMIQFMSGMRPRHIFPTIEQAQQFITATLDTAVAR